MGINFRLAKKSICIVGMLIVAISSFFIIANANRNTNLARLDNLIRTIELPDTIEIIAIQSAVGDSGGNGNHRTLRSVMLVRTNTTIESLSETLVNLGFHHMSMAVRNWEYPEFNIHQATGYQFRSPREFQITFNELKSVDEFQGYYFIEFIR